MGSAGSAVMPATSSQQDNNGHSHVSHSNVIAQKI